MLARRLRGAIHGIQPGETAELQRPLHRYVASTTTPPTYAVRLVLTAVFNDWLSWRDDVDGIRTVCVRFEGATWEVRLGKLYAWSLLGPPGQDAAAERLRRKLTAGGKIVNAFISRMAREKISRDEFFVFNTYQRTRFYYEHFRNATLRALRSRKTRRRLRRLEIAPDVSDSHFFHVLSQCLLDERERDALCAAMVMFFFALTELLLDTCYSLGDRRGVRFHAFRRLDWVERFKFVFDVEDPLLRGTYQRILSIRERHRNVLAHAAPLILIVDELVGAFVPQDPNNMDDPRWNSLYAFGKEDAREVIAAFDALDEYFETHELAALATAFLETMLPVYIHQGAVKSLYAKHGGSPQQLLEALRCQRHR